LKSAKLDRDYQQSRGEAKKRLDEYESQIASKSEREQENLGKELSEALDKEKREFAKAESEKSESYQ
jgi:hypothetical protein